MPFIFLIPLVLRGLGSLHAATIRRLYGAQVGWWVLPATILQFVLGVLVFASWTQQL